MKISSNFSLVLSSKVNQNQNFTNFRANFNDSNDKFVSQNSVSFKANAPAKAITDMIKSKSYWKIVGATVAFVSAAIWEALKKSGVQEDDITLDQIQDMIKEFSPQGSMTSNEGETSVLVNLPEIRRGRKKKIKEEQKVETSATQPTVTPEVVPTPTTDTIEPANVGDWGNISQTTTANDDDLWKL